MTGTQRATLGRPKAGPVGMHDFFLTSVINWEAIPQASFNSLFSSAAGNGACGEAGAQAQSKALGTSGIPRGVAEIAL